MLKLCDISKTYEEIIAVDSVSFEVRQGEALALVGPNGSGKSTLLKMMIGIVKPSSGKILFEDNPLSGKRWMALKRLVGYMPERVSFYDNLTGLETLQLFAKVKGGSLDSIDRVIHRILADDVLQRKVGGYSKGMRQRLNLAQALLNEPDLLILDEPTSGLDPVGKKDFYAILAEVRAERQLTVVLSSHILAEIEDRTDRIGIMKNGQLKAIGRLEEFYTKMQLPSRIVITIDHKDQVLEALLAANGAGDLNYENGYLRANLPRENKLDIVSAIIKEKDRFIDFSIREPSLEEVFFGIH